MFVRLAVTAWLGGAAALGGTVVAGPAGAAEPAPTGWEVPPRLWSDPVVVGSGRVVASERATAPFARLEIRVPFPVRVDASPGVGTGGGVTVTVDDNLQDRITCRVRGDTLVVAAAPGSRSNAAGLIVVSTGTLRALAAYSAGPCRVAGLNGVLAVDQYGSAPVDLAGAVDSLAVRSYGSGRIDAANLISDNVIVDVFGCGDVTVNPVRRLAAAVYGSGRIICLGDPAERRLQDRGSGHVSFP